METDKSILITGGTGLIGRELVKAFSKNGYKTYFTSRSAEKIVNLQREIPGAHGFTFDFSKSAPGDFISLLEREGITTINCVIHAYRDTANLKTDAQGLPSEEQWLSEYKAAVIVPYHLTMVLAEKGLKAAVLVSSIYGANAANMALYDGDQQKAPVHYNIAKAAENHAARELAVRLGPRSVRVNAIAYGGVKGRAPEAFMQKYDSLCPYKGMLEPSNVAGSALFLCSDAAEHITGQVINVDGGWGVW